MKKWFVQWLGGRASGIVAEPALPSASAPVVLNAEQPYDGSEEINLHFLKWLAGSSAREAPPPTERMILHELARLTKAPATSAQLVPRVPDVIPQLLQTLRDENSSGADLSRQISQDVVLVAEVIREANKAYYRTVSPVRTIEGAVLVLGQNGMRMLLARVAFRPIISMQSGRLARQVAPQLWSQAGKCALAAHQLAPALGANPFEAYLAGLMQNVGLIIAFRLVDRICPKDTLPLSEKFCSDLLAATRMLSATIAREWDFPEQVAAAIEQMGQAEAPPLAQSLEQGDWLAKLRLLVDAGVLAADHPLLDRIDAAQRRCFDKLGAEEE